MRSGRIGVSGASFARPEPGNEKGGVEGEAGFFRRNHWVPVPIAVDLEELNRQRRLLCQADQSRLIAGRDMTVGAGMLVEHDQLLPLATEPFDLAEISFPTVDGSGCVRVRRTRIRLP